MKTCAFRPRPFAVVAAFAIGAAACGSSTKTNVTSPSSVRCQATVNNSASSFGAAGGTGSISIGVARECSWSAAPSASWIAITSPKEGQGDGTVTYRVLENPDPVTRSAAISVSEQQVALSQQGAACRYEVGGGAAAVGPDGGQMSISVRTHSACAWNAASDVDFAAVSPSSGRGDGSVQVSVAPNAAAASRSVLVTVAGERVSTTQAGRNAPNPPAPNPPAPNPPAPNPPAPNPPAPNPPSPNPPSPPAPSPDPAPVRQVDIDGRIASLSGSCPAVQFTVKERTVYTTAGTEFSKGKCQDLRRDTKVEVEGWLMSDGRIRADKVKVDK